MATHSSILAWSIPWTEKPGGLRSVESKRVEHDRVTNTFTFNFQFKKIIIIKQPKQMKNKIKIFST